MDISKHTKFVPDDAQEITITNDEKVHNVTLTSDYTIPGLWIDIEDGSLNNKPQSFIPAKEIKNLINVLKAYRKDLAKYYPELK